MLNTPFSNWPNFTQEEADAVARVILSNKVNYWTAGDTGEIRSFEVEFSDWCNTKYAIGLMNGTVALDVILKALEIGPGDDVVVTSRSFFASASCVVTAGANPVFADVDRDTQNISSSTIAAVLTPETRAIIAVHLAGMPCDMDPICELASARGIAVIEDCAQAHGARYKGRPVGSIGDAAAWSFCQDKIMTTGGEGGMVTTNDPKLWSRMWSYKDHGKSFEAVFSRQHTPGFRWVHETFGTNWRMLEMQAAIGRLQLRRMSDWTAARRRNANLIWEAARQVSCFRVPPLPPWGEHAAYKCYIFVDTEHIAAGWSRDRMLREINIAGVPAYSGSCPEIYLEKAFQDTPWRPAQRLNVARQLGDTSIMFLVHPTLTDAEIRKTCDVLTDVGKRAVLQT